MKILLLNLQDRAGRLCQNDRAGQDKKVSNHFCPARTGRDTIKSRAGQGNKIGPVDTSAIYYQKKIHRTLYSVIC